MQEYREKYISPSPQDVFKKMFVEHRNDFTVRQAIQVLVLMEMGVELDRMNNDIARDFSDMYDENYVFEDKGVKVYSEKLAYDQKVDEAIEFVKRAFETYRGSTKKEYKEAA